MQNQYKDIDHIIQSKMEHLDVDTNMAEMDFGAIQNQLPTNAATPSVEAPKIATKTIGSKAWLLGLLAAAAFIGGVVLVSNYNSKNNDGNLNASAIKTKNATVNLNDTINKESVESDTPVIVYEIPKDPKTAPKRWIYRMPIKFDGKTDNRLPKKQYIDLSDIQSGETKLVSFNSDVLYNAATQENEKFLINADADQYIETKKGSKYFIQAHTFLTTEKIPAVGKITVFVDEVKSFRNMIGFGLNTDYKNDYISTHSMIRITAKLANQELLTTVDKPIQGILKTNRFNTKTQMFNLTEKGWLANGQFQNADLNENLTKGDFRFYKFNMYHLNWITVGGFANNENKSDITITHSYNNQSTTAYLMLPNLQVCTGIVTNNNQIQFKNIGLQQNATLLLLVKNNGTEQAYMYDLEVNNQNTILQKTAPLSGAQVKAKLDALGKLQ